MVSFAIDRHPKIRSPIDVAKKSAEHKEVESIHSIHLHTNTVLTVPVRNWQPGFVSTSDRQLFNGISSRKWKMENGL